VVDLFDSSATARAAERAGSVPPVTRLDLYSTKDFDRGRPRWLEVIWLLTQAFVLASPFSSSRLRILMLRLFGARIGRGATIKPRVRVKFPWRLDIGDHCWLGEDVWLDNLADIRIGNHCCLSQGAYLCTGSHDWTRAGFDLVIKPIILEDEVWLAARSVVGPGVIARRGAVLALGSVATRELLSWHIHQGLPAVPIRPRRVEPGAHS
jgi:putative colanic acid biosynthesis acetyltransferase WcaF